MGLEMVTVSEASQTEKDRYYTGCLRAEPGQRVQMNLSMKQEESQVWKQTYCYQG